ncbi:MAG: chitobiase/beta-hexosaminidase C-terminal domain-containing protein [Paludibacter sp.]|nr:chitobiase/beta-hexosaminidase C-terminal domain-containing protein [Paludibacter sp.]
MKKITFLRNLIVLVALLVGSGSAMGQTTINFDNAGSWVQDGSTALTSYANHAYVESGVTIQGTIVVRNTTSAQDGFPGALGTYSMRLRDATGSKALITIASGGVADFSFKVRRWDGSPLPEFTVKYSVDGGSNWTNLTTINGTLLTTSEFFTYTSGVINSDVDNFQIEILRTAGERIMIDDFTWTGYIGGGTPTVATPSIEVTSGVAKTTDTYFNTAEVTISSATEGASIYYTTNGDDPTTSSTLYSAPFNVTTTSTVKALAVKTDMDDSGIASKTITIVAPATATVPYSEAFNNTLGDWYNYEVAGTKPWYASADGAIANGYNGGDVESWLISPKFTATEDGLNLTFNYASKYVGDPILVKVSSDYIGYGSPAAANWTTLSTILAPEVQDDAYTVKLSGNIINAASGTTYFALVYDAAAAPYSDWRITNASIDLPPAGPTITVTEAEVPAMSAYADATDTETITVNGLNLTGDITLALSGTDAAQFSLSTSTLSPTAGSVTDASVTITYEPTAAGSHTATLTLSSAGASDVTRSLSGTATWAPLDAPVATAASGVSSSGFTANWEAVTGATEYELSVYTKEGGLSANSFVNPGYESTELTPWNFETGMNQEIVTNIIKSGTQSLRTSVVATKKITQSVNVINGKEYKLSFWYYIDEASTGSGFRVWTTNGATIYLPSSTTYFNTKGSWEYVETLFTPTSDIVLFEIRTYNGNTMYLDDFELVYDETSLTQIAGSPFSVTDGTSKAITGLSSSSTYYYTVKAKNTNVTSETSNEIVASILSGNNNPSLTSIYAHNANIHFTATAGEKVEVYNAVGQKIISTLATDGQNELPVNAKGVMIVKVGSRLAKVIL